MTVKLEHRFLVVDDHTMMRTIVHRALKEIGFTAIDEAPNGTEALAKINAAFAAGKPYTVVLCDWMMPEVTGLDVVTACRAREETKDLPIIMITAEAESKQVVKALKAGANDYIVKPVSVQTLRSKLDRVMQRLKPKAA